METVDDAIRAGKTHLVVTCGPCRLIHEIPWRRLSGVMGNDKLADVARRLTCTKCGTRPDPETVKPSCQSDAPGYVRYYRH